tara:strand:+ start:576 stop:755 length:180 start_codon:yes stop_codon:yes gene_type:complete
MINWLKKLFSKNKHTPYIRPYFNSQHKATMNRKISVPMADRRVAAARGVELEPTEQKKD